MSVQQSTVVFLRVPPLSGLHLFFFSPLFDVRNFLKMTSTEKCVIQVPEGLFRSHALRNKDMQRHIFCVGSEVAGDKQAHCAFCAG